MIPAAKHTPTVSRTPLEIGYMPAIIDFLGDHPKPASRDYLKTGQLQTRTKDKIVLPYL